MALDSLGNANHRSAKHARHPTPVIPALPLGFGNAKWQRSGRQSRPTSQQNNAIESVPVVEATALPADSEDATVSEQQDPVPAIGKDASEQAQIIPPIDEEETAINADNGDRPQQASLVSDEVMRAELKSQGNNEINEAVPAAIDPSQEPQAALSSLAYVHKPEKSVSYKQDDGEALTSELDLSSAAPSNTTGVTDYGSSVAESALETVTDGNSYGRRPSAGRHRKSEIAPEVSLNGASPRRPHDEFRKHQRAINGSSVSQRNAIEASPMLPVHDYLVFLCNNKQFSDVVLQVNQADRSYQPSLHATHSLLLMRSERLSKFSAEYDSVLQSKVINLFPARNILPHAFEAALRFFYVDHLLSLPTILPSATYRDPAARAQALEYIMSYWISGVELGIGPVKARSYELLKEVLDLDVAEIVAKEIRDLRSTIGGLPTKDAQDEVQDIADTLSRLLAQLLRGRINFEEFALMSEPPTPTSALQPRFADLDLNRSSNPALSGVVFGSLPNQSPVPSPHSIASIILLHVDFDTLVVIASDLITFLGRIGENVIRQVLYQREEDRQQIVANRAVSNKQRLDNSAWHSAGVKESIDEHGRLKQERVGFILPSRTR